MNASPLRSRISFAARIILGGALLYAGVVKALQPAAMSYLRHIHSRAHATMAPSQEVIDMLQREGIQHTHLLGRGVDTQLFNPARRNVLLRRSWGAGEHDIVAMYVGRLAAEKNLPVVIQTYQTMRIVRPNTKLVFVGDGPELPRLQREFPQGIFAGMRVREQLAEHYASADVFLFPSTTETYGNVTVEAMASGLAVIAYDYAAARQHIRHSINGLKAPFDATDEFIKLAIGLAPHTARIRALGAAARVTTEKLDWSCIVTEFEQALLGLIDAQPLHSLATADAFA